jgi:hypothetical protein
MGEVGERLLGRPVDGVAVRVGSEPRAEALPEGRLYGEGWNFGEVQDDALFEQARQGNLGGTGIGTFSGSGVPLMGSPFGSVASPVPKPCRKVEPLSTGLPPCTASRSRSLKVPMPVPPRFPWRACSKRASSCTSPKFHPRQRLDLPAGLRHGARYRPERRPHQRDARAGARRSSPCRRRS